MPSGSKTATHSSPDNVSHIAPLDRLDRDQLSQLVSKLEQRFAEVCDQRLSLDLTRGKPSAEQLSLSESLDGILDGNYLAADGTDTRGYGGLDGLPEAKAIGAQLLDMPASQVIVGGNSSLTLMYLYLMHAHLHQPDTTTEAWQKQAAPPSVLCPVPGYDRHFAICEDLNIDMIPVALNDDGQDMDQVEALVEAKPEIRAIWCVPKHSNPSGVTYSDAVVSRIAKLARRTKPGFKVLWDNAYAVHDLYEPAAPLLNIWHEAQELGTENAIVAFASTSKITFAGAGLAFLGGSDSTLDAFRERLSFLTIGPDKVNQLRHAKLLPDRAAIDSLMRRPSSHLATQI